MFVKESPNLDRGEVAAEGLNGLSELLASDGSVTFLVEVLENLLDGFAFVLGTVGLLTNLFANDVLELVDACSGNVVLRAGVTTSTNAFDRPHGADGLLEPLVFLRGQHAELIQVVIHKSLLRNVAISKLVLSHTIAEILPLGFLGQLSGDDAGMCSSLVLFLEDISVD